MNNVIEGFELLNEKQEVLSYIISQIEKLGLNDDPFKIKDGNVNNGNNNNPNDNNANGNNIDNNMNQNNGSDSQDINDATKEAQSNANQALQQEQNELKQEQQNQEGEENNPNEAENQNQDNNNGNENKYWITSADTNFRPKPNTPIYYYNEELYNNNQPTDENPIGNFEKDSKTNYNINGVDYAKYEEDENGNIVKPLLMYPREQAEKVNFDENGEDINDTNSSDWIKGTDPNYSPTDGTILYRYDEEIFNGNEDESNAQPFGAFIKKDNDKSYRVKQNDGKPLIINKEQFMYKKSDAKYNSQSIWIQGGESDTNPKKKKPSQAQLLYQYNEDIYKNNGPESQAKKIGFWINEDNTNYTYKPFPQNEIKKYYQSDFTNDKKGNNLNIFKELALYYDAPNLFPSVTVAQAIVESGWGTDKNFKSNNNCFNIHGHGYKNVVSGTDTDANGNQYDTDFRRYETVNDAFLNRIKFLYENPRYRENGVFNANTPEEQIQALKKAGYWQGANGEQLLLDVLRQNNLTELDSQRNTQTVTVQKQETMYLLGNSGSNGGSGNGNDSNGNNNNNNDNQKKFDESTESESMEINGYIRGDNLRYIPKVGAKMYVKDPKNEKQLVEATTGTFQYRQYGKKAENNKKIQIENYQLSKGSAQSMHIWYKKTDADGIGQKYVKNETFPIKYGQESEKIRNIQNVIFTDKKCIDGRFGPVMLDIFYRVYGIKDTKGNKINALSQVYYNKIIGKINKNEENENRNEKISGDNDNGLMPQQNAKLYANKDCPRYSLTNGGLYHGKNEYKNGDFVGYMGDASDIIEQDGEKYYRFRDKNNQEQKSYIKAKDVSFTRNESIEDNPTWLLNNFTKDQLETLRNLIWYYKEKAGRTEGKAVDGALYDMQDKNRKDIKAHLGADEANEISQRRCSYSDINNAFNKTKAKEEEEERNKPQTMTFLLERKDRMRTSYNRMAGAILGEISLNGEKTLFYTMEKSNVLVKPGKYQIILETSPDRNLHVNTDKKNADYTPIGNGEVEYGEYVYGNDEKIKRRDKNGYIRVPLLKNVQGREGIQIHPGKDLGWTKGCILISKRSAGYTGFNWSDSVNAYHEFWNMIRKDFDDNFNPIKGAEVWIEIKNNFKQ